MVTMAQSAKNWRNTHIHMDCPFTHTLYINTVTTTCCEAPTELLFFSACWVFSCFCNPPNSDMDYRTFNVRTWSFLCVCIHMGGGHTDRESGHFWLRKTLKMFLCPRFPCNYMFFFFHIVTTINRLIILPLFTFSACWVFLCFRNPPNSDITWTTGLLTCVRDHS